MKSSEQKPRPLVDPAEQDTIDRKMLVWADNYQAFPVAFVKSFVETKAPAVGLQVITGASVVSRYITGGYLAEYPFSVTYRIAPGGSEDKRLSALELLNGFGAWASGQRPNIGDGLRVVRVEPTTRAFLLAAYDDGDVDYQIQMKMTYERVS